MRTTKRIADIDIIAVMRDSKMTPIASVYI